MITKTREELWLARDQGKVIERIDLRALPDHKFVPMISEQIESMEWIEKKRIDSWPEEFAEKFNEAISALHFVDERMRYEQWMMPRLGKKKFQSPELVTCESTPNKVITAPSPWQRKQFRTTEFDICLQIISRQREALEEHELFIMDDDLPRSKFIRLNKSISVLIELESRLTTRLGKGKK